jgi:hypothetical protein
MYYKAPARVGQGEPYDRGACWIIIGDGHDTASKKSLEKCSRDRSTELVTIYTSNFAAFGFNVDGEKSDAAGVQRSGGRVSILEPLYKDAGPSTPTWAICSQSGDGRLPR